MAGFGRGERGRDGLEVAHLAHQDHVRVLAQAAAQGAGKVLVSEPTSRWWITQPLGGVYMYSTGSSMVTMWHRRVALMCWIMAARVVDLPLPVGPVTSTRPRGWFANMRTAGKVQVFQGGNLGTKKADGGAQNAPAGGTRLRAGGRPSGSAWKSRRRRPRRCAGA